MQMTDSLKPILKVLMARFKKKLEIETRNQLFLMIGKAKDLSLLTATFLEDHRSQQEEDCLLQD